MALTSSITANVRVTMDVVESLNGDGIDHQQITHGAFNVGLSNLSATSAILVDSASVKTFTLSGGTKTIDLQAIATTISTAADWSGKKLQAIRFTNPAANAAMTITGEGANGYSLGGAITVPAASATNAVTITITAPEALADVASGDRYLVVTGTGSQSFNLELIAG